MKMPEPMTENGIILSSLKIMELIQAIHEKGASFRFQASGFSMTPSIRDGDVITISPLVNIPPRRGDVLAFRCSERSHMLVHRVLWRKDDKFLIRGDNCPYLDGWIPSRDIIGIITRVERKGDHLYWPDRRSALGRLYLFLYALWLPLRRFLVRGNRLPKARMKKR